MRDHCWDREFAESSSWFGKNKTVKVCLHVWKSLLFCFLALSWFLFAYLIFSCLSLEAWVVPSSCSTINTIDRHACFNINVCDLVKSVYINSLYGAMVRGVCDWWVTGVRSRHLNPLTNSLQQLTSFTLLIHSSTSKTSELKLLML